MKHPMVYAIVIGLALLLALITVIMVPTAPPGASPTTQATPKTVKIGYQKTVLYLPIFVADRRGVFEKLGLKAKLQRFESASDMIDALVGGDIDATGMSALEQVAKKEAEGPGRLRMFLIEGFGKEPWLSSDYILAKSNSGIKSIEDLRGKKLAVRSGKTFMMYAEIILKKKGLIPGKDVEVIVVPDDEHSIRLRLGHVDAVFTFEPRATQILHRGEGYVLEPAVLARFLFDEPKTIFPGAAVVTTKFVQSDPETVRKLRDAIYEAVDFIKSNPDEAKAILGQYTGDDQSVVAKMSLIRWFKPTDVDKEEVQNLVSLYHRHGVLDKDVNLRGSYLTDADLR